MYLWNSYQLAYMIYINTLHTMHVRTRDVLTRLIAVGLPGHVLATLFLSAYQNSDLNG